MIFYDAAIDRDANRQVISSNESFKLESTWTFVESTTGAVGTHTLFTVTGNVLVTVFAACNGDLTSSGSATLSVGVVGNTTAFITATDYFLIDNDRVWASNTPGFVRTVPSAYIDNDLDIVLKINNAAVTGGVIDFYCLWRPLSEDGKVEVVTPA